MISAVRRARPSGLATISAERASGRVHSKRPIACGLGEARIGQRRVAPALVAARPVPFGLAVPHEIMIVALVTAGPAQAVEHVAAQRVPSGRLRVVEILGRIAGHAEALHDLPRARFAGTV